MLSHLIFTYPSAAIKEKKIINDIANINIKNEKTTSSGVILQKRIFRCVIHSKFHQTKATNENKAKQDCRCYSCQALLLVAEEQVVDNHDVGRGDDGVALLIMFHVQRERS